MSLCDDCFKGVRHDGTPKGTIEKINGFEVYVTLPEKEYAKEKAILFLTDAFGMRFENNQLLADDFAANGFAVYMPDYLENNPYVLGSKDFDVHKWLASHPVERVHEIVDATIAGLKERGINTFGATGYCFGGRSVFHYAFNNVTKVSVVAHPSLLTVPDDLEKYLKQSKAPLLINSCTGDQQFPPESQAIADDLLGNGKFAPGYERTYWDGCNHGFAVRCDLTDPKQKAGKEGAFKASVEFFRKHL